MKDILTALLSLAIILLMLVYVAALTLGCFEILWWVFTGDFFHFVSSTTSAF